MRPSEIDFDAYEAEEGGYYAVAQGFGIITQGDSWDDLKFMVEDAVLCHFDDGYAPHSIRLNFVNEESLT